VWRLLILTTMDQVISIPPILELFQCMLFNSNVYKTAGRKRQKVSRANPFSTRQNLNTLILEAVSQVNSKQRKTKESYRESHISK
jgi:hypothetical protein